MSNGAKMRVINKTTRAIVGMMPFAEYGPTDVMYHAGRRYLVNYHRDDTDCRRMWVTEF